MLGSLARKLRIFGFDTVYFKGNDRELERLAKDEARVILTCDRALVGHASRLGVKAILVEGRTDRARLASVGRKVGFHRSGPSRCAVCNGDLEVVSKAEASSTVPPRVAARHRVFFRCPECGRLYWKGGHWSRLRRLSRALTKD